MTSRGVPLGELVTIVGGGTPDRSEPSYWGPGNPWATVKDLTDLELARTQENITPAGLKSSASTLVPAGTVIVATRMALGKAVINSVDVAINQDLKALTCRSNLEPRYLLHFLVSRAPWLERMGKGATVKGITLDRLRELPVPLPPLVEQRRIAAMLDKADGVRRKRRESIRLVDEFLRSAFLEMFGDPVRNEKGWEVVRLGDCLATKPVIGTITPAVQGGESTLIRVGEIGEHDVALDRCGCVSITREAMDRFEAQEGDLLLARAIGSEEHLGKASVLQSVGEPVVFDSHVMRVRPDLDRLHASFLWQWLQTAGGRRLFLKHGGRTAVQFNVNATQVSEVRIPLPPLDQQERFVELAVRARAVQRRQGASSAEAGDLFASLAWRAFLGEG